MLANKIFRRIYRIVARARRNSGKWCIGIVTKLAERALAGIEGEVNSRRRYRVNTVGVNILKKIITVNIGNSLAVLRASHSDYGSRNTRAIAAVGYPALYLAKSGCRSIEANPKHGAGATRQIVKTAVGGDDKIDGVGSSSGKWDGRARRRIKTANPSSAKLSIEIFANIVVGKVYGSRIVKSSSRYRASGST